MCLIKKSNDTTASKGLPVAEAVLLPDKILVGRSRGGGCAVFELIMIGMTNTDD